MRFELLSSFLALYKMLLRIHWRLSTILKTSKNVYEIMLFWCVKVLIFWKCIQYIINWDKTQMLKKISFGQNKRYKIFLSQAPTYHSFTFNLWFFYELKHKGRLSKKVSGIFQFQFRFVFIKVYIFVQQNASTLKRHNSVQN